jgi:hypothetical protein
MTIQNTIGITHSFDEWKNSQTGIIPPYGCSELDDRRRDQIYHYLQKYTMFMVNPVAVIGNEIFSITNIEIASINESFEFFIKRNLIPYAVFQTDTGSVMLQASFSNKEKHHLTELFDDGERFVQYYCNTCNETFWVDMELGGEIPHQN